MSTTGPSAPKTVAEESQSNSPSQASTAYSSLRNTPTDTSPTIKDDPKNAACAIDKHKENSRSSAQDIFLSTECKVLHTFWDKDDCLDGGGDGLASWDDDGGSIAFGSSTPPVIRWASSLQNLLNDKDGSDRFKLFLENRGPKHSKMMVEFWYACKGLPYVDDIPGTIEAVWGKYIKRDLIKVVSEEARKIIKEEIEKKKFNIAIFDKARQEVEAAMKLTIYPNFLKSEYCAVDIFGKENVCYNTELHGHEEIIASQLSTVHENSEFSAFRYKPSVRPKCSHRLTPNNLLDSQFYRADNSGNFLHHLDNFAHDYCHADYMSGHAISLQNSEIQSMSSGTTRTDRSSSCKSGSFDGVRMLSSNRQMQFAKNYAKLNKEEPSNIASLTTSYLPRTMKDEKERGPTPSTNPKEFHKVLNEKLEKVKEDIETNERVQQSLCKLSHSEDNADEVRRQHAENSLPPNLLRNKLQEKRFLDDNEQNLSDQSILDNHIKTWDPSTASPGSPKYHAAPIREAKMRQLPHLNLPQPPFYNPAAPCHPRNVNKGRHFMNSTALHSAAGTPLDGHPAQRIPRICNPARRRERGHDVYSNLSSDSGNVADYHDSSERFPSSNLPKSRSMPDYIENQQGSNDGGGSCGRRRQVSGSRRSVRRPQGDLTDSGVSDSGRSGATATSTSVKSASITDWLSNCSEQLEKDYQRNRGTRSASHSIAAISSVSSAQKSQCSSSASTSTTALTTTTVLSHLSQELSNLELSRDSPLGQSQTHIVSERRKIKGNGSSSSSKSTGDGGSNGSTLRHCKSANNDPSSVPLIVLMYHFPDDKVPYVVKLRSSAITLKMFKEHLPKKGNYRYFFKTVDEDVDCPVVHLEVTDDEAEVPLYEGKIVSHMRDA